MSVTTGLPATGPELARWAIPADELHPTSIADVLAMDTFRSTLRRVGQRHGVRFGVLPQATQTALVHRRLTQLLGIARVNPVWRERLAAAPDTVESDEDWAGVPLTGKDTATELFTGTRPGLVVPIEQGGYQVVASGGTTGGQPSETVYELRELADTYAAAGRFIGRHMLPAHMGPQRPRWLATTLADYQMWSSGTMVGGVLASVPGVNYVGAGPMSPQVFAHLMAYPGPKALMGISASIASLPALGAGLDAATRRSLKVAMYGSGQLTPRAAADLYGAYPNVKLLSYFAATQAEAIGLQLDPSEPALATVPGLHLVEVVGPDGRAVEVGQAGELVVTRLMANWAPVLRYVVGDRVVRLPDLATGDLNTHQFLFTGRSSDVLHIADSQYPARPALVAIFAEFRAQLGIDLEASALDVQFVNDRRTRELVLIITATDAAGLRGQLAGRLGPEGSAPLLAAGLVQALSVFNSMEANPEALRRSGYFFGIRVLPPDSPEIRRTDVGKVPLVVDRVVGKAP